MNGQPVFIDEEGMIRAGMGGKFNGKKLDEMTDEDWKQRGKAQEGEKPEEEWRHYDQSRVLMRPGIYGAMSEISKTAEKANEAVQLTAELQACGDVTDGFVEAFFGPDWEDSPAAQNMKESLSALYNDYARSGFTGNQADLSFSGTLLGVHSHETEIGYQEQYAEEYGSEIGSELYSISEEEWNTQDCPWYRPGIEWQEGMTNIRAEREAKRYDRILLLQYFTQEDRYDYSAAAKIGGTIAGNLLDTSNLIPVGGGLAAAGKITLKQAAKAFALGAGKTALENAYIYPFENARGANYTFADYLKSIPQGALEWGAGEAAGAVVGRIAGQVAGAARRWGKGTVIYKADGGKINEVARPVVKRSVGNGERIKNHPKSKEGKLYDYGRKVEDSEQRGAEAWNQAGYDVEIRENHGGQKGNQAKGDKSADLHVERVGIVEVYTPEMNLAAQRKKLPKKISEKAKQSGIVRVITDLTNEEMDIIAKRIWSNNDESYKRVEVIFFQDSNKNIFIYKRPKD